jgi:hypothetical protein
MKVIRTLLILILTLFWVVITASLYASSTSYLTLAVITFVYGLLLYVVWPVGTPNPAVAANRLFYAFGVGMLLLALDTAFGNHCPHYPYHLVVMYPKPSGVAALIMSACLYLGKYPAALLLSGIGGYFFYMEYSLKPDLSSKRWR